MTEDLNFGYSSPLEDMDLATSLCLLDYNDRYITIPNEIWRNHGYKILMWFDHLYDNQVTYCNSNTSNYCPVTLVLPRPLEEKINIEEFLVWIKLSNA